MEINNKQFSNPSTITVVTISYNCLSDLKHTVENVLKQTSRPDEYIIVDGGSSDGTKEYLETLRQNDSNIIIISEPDTGISNAMNKGMHLATKEWVCYLHSGDTFHDEYVISDIRTNLNNIDTGFLYGKCKVVDQQGQTVRIWNPPTYSSKLLSYRNYIPHQTVFFRRDLLIGLNGFDESIRIPMDYDLWLRASKVGVYGQKIDRIVCRFLDGGLSSKWWPMLMEERRVRLRNYPKGVISGSIDYLYTILRYIKNLPKNSW